MHTCGRLLSLTGIRASRQHVARPASKTPLEGAVDLLPFIYPRGVYSHLFREPMTKLDADRQRHCVPKSLRILQIRVS